LYFVRELNASDAWIGLLYTAQTAVLVVGYFFWSRQSRRKGSRFVLLITTFSVSLYPALVALTANQIMIFIFSTAAGIFQAGIDLVFFDELMKTIPPRYSPTFVSLAQSIQYLSAILAPLVGTYLAEHIGLTNALLFSTLIRLFGFVLFARQDHHSAKSTL
jgi:MFS family permease